MPHADDEALLWLASQEGLRLRPYKDPDGNQWNIGFGHLLSYGAERPRVKPLKPYDAWRLLKHDWNKSKEYANKALKQYGVTPKNPGVPMSLALLAFNAGPGIFRTRRFKRAVQAGEPELLQWARSVNTVNGQPDAGLTKRRNAEFSWAVAPDRYPLPISESAKKNYMGFIKTGPQPTPTPIPDHDIPGEAPARFNKIADLSLQNEVPMDKVRPMESKHKLENFSDALSRYRQNRAAVEGEGPGDPTEGETTQGWLTSLPTALAQGLVTMYQIGQRLKGTGGETAQAAPPASPTPSPSPSPRTTPVPKPAFASTSEPEPEPEGIDDVIQYEDGAAPETGPERYHDDLSDTAPLPAAADGESAFARGLHRLALERMRAMDAAAAESGREADTLRRQILSPAQRVNQARPARRVVPSR